MFPSLRASGGGGGSSGWESAYASPSRSITAAAAYPTPVWPAMDHAIASSDAYSHTITPRTTTQAGMRSSGGSFPAAAIAAARRHSGGAPIAVPSSASRSHPHAYAHLHSDADSALMLHSAAGASPVRSLRTPAGLALSYEHGGRHARAVRRELHMPDSPARMSGTSSNAAAATAAAAGAGIAAQSSPAHVAASGIATAAPSGLPSASAAGLAPLPSVGYLPSLISHAHFTPVSPLPTHAGLAAMLNRVASPKAGGRSIATVQQPGDTAMATLASGGEETKEASLYPAAAAAPASATSMHGAGTGGSHRADASCEKHLTAVQRQRAHRAALLSKALSKPAVVHALDRRRVDNLESLLSHRSQVAALVKRRILPGEEAEQKKKSAELHQRKASLAHFFAPGSRPSAQLLAHKNILRERGGEADSNRAAKKERLSSFIAHRPSIVQVSSKLAAPRSRLSGAGAAAGGGAGGLAAHSRHSSSADGAASALEEGQEGQTDASADHAALDRANEEDADAAESTDAIGDFAAERQQLQPHASNPSSPSSGHPSGVGGEGWGGSGSGPGHVGGQEKLSSLLSRRPDYSELEKRNIVRPPMVRQMSFSNLRSNVSKLLSTRPSMSDLKHMAQDLLRDMVGAKIEQAFEMQRIDEQEQQLQQEEEEEEQQRQGEARRKSQTDDPTSGSAAAAAAAAGPRSPHGVDGVAPVISLSLESLQSSTLKIDEILSQKRRDLARKLRQKKVEEEVGGGVWMSGSNERGQTGFQGALFLLRPEALRSMVREVVAQVCCGFEHTLVRTEGGACYAYGINSYGQLGLGDQLDRDQPFSLHFRGSPLYKRRVTWVAANAKTSAFVCDANESGGAAAAVFTAGSLRTGSLGTGEDPDSQPDADPLGAHCCRSLPASLPELRNKSIIRVSLGGSHGAAVDSTGVLWLWGRCDQGQLGNGDFVSQWKPTQIKSYGEFWSTEISCGENHTAAIGFDNNTYLWGSNRNGQLGFPTAPEWNSPQPSPKLCMSLFRRGVVKISAGRHHSCCLSEDGDAYSTLIMDAPRVASERGVKFHKLSPRIALVDIVSTPLDSNVAIDAQGCAYTWDSNALDEPRVDDALETRSLVSVSAGLEHRAVLGSINKSWRTATNDGEYKK